MSFIIPAYNSEKYLHKAVDSLLVTTKDIEIIIVNDGSKDQTQKIAEDYALKYPTTVRVINQANGGHGSAINTGLYVAKGTYIKVVDSDDWIDEQSLHSLLEQMENHQKTNVDVDLYITNFVYEHVSDQTQYVRDYSRNFLCNQVFTWQEMGDTFRFSKTLLMHALIYKTSILREIDLQLPKHTFYVDNLYAYIPLPYIKHIFYMNLPLYRYFIGRTDQSITLKNITERYEQQISVQKLILKAYSYQQIKKLDSKLKSYMLHCISSLMMITQMFTVAQTSNKRKLDLKELWCFIKLNDKKMYRFLKYRSMNLWVNLPWTWKQKVMVKGYLYLAKKIKLG